MSDLFCSDRYGSVVITTESRPDSRSIHGHRPQGTKRRRRADGEASRTRILDAATEIAAERGYEGTSIALVSDKCGLPASSIYWHFKDKDDLIAAVIERSFAQWLSAWEIPDDGTAQERFVAIAAQIAKALLDSPDFIRLGLMLALERRPVEPRARAMFIAVRAQAFDTLTRTIRDLTPGLTDAQVHQLATYAMAGADGLFIAKEIGGDSVDLSACSNHGRAIAGGRSDHAWPAPMVRAIIGSGDRRRPMVRDGRLDPDSDGLAARRTGCPRRGRRSTACRVDMTIRPRPPTPRQLGQTRNNGVRMLDLPRLDRSVLRAGVNLDDHLDAPNLNMVTCGGQATVPIVAAVGRAGIVSYAEIVSSISAKSAAPGPAPTSTSSPKPPPPHCRSSAARSAARR